jgi:phage terminase small subunit
VQDAIAKGVSLKEARFQIKADDILVELGKLAMVNMMDYTRVDEDENLVVDFSTLTREQAACIASIENKTFIKGEGAKETEVKFKLTDKRAALVDLGRHFGLFLDRTESNVTHTVTDEPAITDEEWMEDHGAEDER